MHPNSVTKSSIRNECLNKDCARIEAVAKLGPSRPRSTELRRMTIARPLRWSRKSWPIGPRRTAISRSGKSECLRLMTPYVSRAPLFTAQRWRSIYDGIGRRPLGGPLASTAPLAPRRTSWFAPGGHFTVGPTDFNFGYLALKPASTRGGREIQPIVKCKGSH